MTKLDIKDVTVRYNNGHLAIKDVSFSLNSNSICALVGVNGSGKSTLFKSIMGLIKPQKGEIKLNKMPVTKALKQNLVSYVPQSEEVDWSFPISVEDVVMMGRYGYMNMLRIASKDDKRQVLKALDRVGVLNLKNRQIGELSGGQKKRVFLARALAQQSKMILLDEPFTGVDVKTENSIMDLLKELRNEGHLILVSTHNLGTIQEFCDKVVLLKQSVIKFGDTATTFTEENLELAFGGVLRYLHFNKESKDYCNLTVLTDDERAAVFKESK